MTTTTIDKSGPGSAPQAPSAPRAGRPVTGSGLSFLGLIRSEWIKLRSVRSTVWCYGLVVLISVALAAVMASSLDLGGAKIAAADQARFLVQAATFGVFLAQLVVVVLGVLSISGEYTTGMIKSTLTAVPRRLPALWAKAIVLLVTTFVVGVVSTVGAFFVASLMLGGQGLHASLFDTDVILPLLGGAFYLALIAVFALALGTIVRSGAGGIASSLGIVLLLPVVMQMIPADWATAALPYVISNAGINMFGLMDFSQVPITPGQDLLIVLAWIAVSFTAAAVLLKKRDA